MATFYRPGTRKGNRFFIVRGYIDGKEYEVSTGCAIKKGRGGAEEFWDAFKHRVRSKRGADITTETATFADAAVMYRESNPHLSRNDGRYLKRIEASPLAGMLLSEIDSETLKDIAIKLYPNAKPQTRNRQGIAPAAAVMHHAHRRRLCGWLQVERFPEINPHRPVIRSDKGEVAIEAAMKAGDVELSVLLETLVYHGWRVTETLMIEREKIEWRSAIVERWVTKSKEWRRTAVDGIVLKKWRALPEHKDGRLFSYEDRHQVYRSIDALDLPFHYRPHMSRRGFATDLNALGETDISIAQAAQGWKDPRSVHVYTQTDLDQNRMTLGRLRGKLRGIRKDQAG